MQLAVHIPEQGYFFHIVFPHENGVVRIQPHDRYIEIGEMIGAENVLLFRVPPESPFHAHGDGTQKKQAPCPPPVDNPHPMVFFPEQDGVLKQYEENNEGYDK